MPGLLLDKRAAVYRFTNNPGSVPGQAETQVYPVIQCAIVPISSFDAAQSYGYEQTHVIWVPKWLALRKDDEIHWGQRLPDNYGTVAPNVYVVNGSRTFTHAPFQAAYYCREKQ